jgi:hypothetical protein
MQNIPKVTPSQLELLLLLYKFRFLTTNQFQKILNLKTPRKIQFWLKDLLDKKCVSRKYDRLAFGENTKPAIYFLDTNGRQILKENQSCSVDVLKKVYKEKTRSQKFIDHCVAIADFYIFFKNHLRLQETLHFSTQSQLIDYAHFPDPLPDGYIALKGEVNTKRYFLDLFDSNTPYFVVRKRVKQYVEYVKSNTWQYATKSDPPSILFVLPNENAKKHIYYFSKNVLSKNMFENIKLFLTSSGEILKSDNLGQLWLRVDTD